MKYWRYEMGIPDMDGFPGGWDWRETGVLLVGFILPMEMGKWRRTKGPGMKKDGMERDMIKRKSGDGCDHDEVYASSFRGMHDAAMAQ